jgi:hypothetical protein
MAGSAFNYLFIRKLPSPNAKQIISKVTELLSHMFSHAVKAPTHFTSTLCRGGKCIELHLRFVYKIELCGSTEANLSFMKGELNS